MDVKSGLFLAGSILGALAEPASARSSLFPAPGSADLPRDVQATVYFESNPVLTGHGKIQIVESGSKTVIETIDTAVPVATQSIGGLGGFHYYPVTIDGWNAIIHPRNGELEGGKFYEVVCEAGVFSVDGKAMPAIPPGAWRFGTRQRTPPPGAPTLIVAADGSGDFCTVQGALDFIPIGSTAPITVRLKPGTYLEMVFFTDKHSITVAGEDRERCIIGYANNEKFNPGGGNPYAAGNNPGSSALLAGKHVYHRGVFLAHRARDFTLTNLTIYNTTEHGGSQAEALILNGETDARARVENVHLLSFQDTVQINGQAYVHGSLIEGDVDFMWGTGPCYWSDCVCRANNDRGYYTQVRNPAGRHGFVYNHCVLEGYPPSGGVLLSRIEPARFPGSEVVFLDCTMNGAVAPVGWQLQRSSDPAQVKFLEYASHRPDGRPVDDSARLPASRRLTQPKDAGQIANYQRRDYVLGNGWNP